MQVSKIFQCLVHSTPPESGALFAAASCSTDGFGGALRYQRVYCVLFKFTNLYTMMHFLGSKYDNYFCG